jgi:hypothetical protein
MSLNLIQNLDIMILIMGKEKEKNMSQKICDYIATLNVKGRTGDMNPVVIWDNENVVLIDTGLPQQFDILKSELAEIGLTPGQITHILFTHHDIDHIGCAKEFQKESPKIETIAHEKEASYINGQKIPHKLAALEANVENLSAEERGFYEMLKQGFANRQIEITKTVKDGDLLPICGGIQVILTSGHTIGHVSYYLIESKVLIGGDAVNAANGELRAPNPMYSYDMKNAMGSLEKLLLFDIETIVAYHGGIVEGNIQGRIKMLIDAEKPKHQIYTMSFARVYPLLVSKAEKKGRTKAEVDEIIHWLTGYTQDDIMGLLEKQIDYETFFQEAPLLNPLRTGIKGVVCGVRVEDIKEPIMQEIRYMDKLIDELAKGKSMDKILRT